eukprot:3992778-Prymnesium_polylepis.1
MSRVHQPREGSTLGHPTLRHQRPADATYAVRKGHLCAVHGAELSLRPRAGVPLAGQPLGDHSD